MTWPPVSSQEAAELREQEAAQSPLHDTRCDGGWLSENPQSRPIPCLACRPHLAHLHRYVSTP